MIAAPCEDTLRVDGPGEVPLEEALGQRVVDEAELSCARELVDVRAKLTEERNGERVV
jgi:hypothetical protein